MLEKFRSGGYAVSVFENKEEACSYMLGKLAGKSVGVGGCMTAVEIGLMEKLTSVCKLSSHWNSASFAEAAAADAYVLSANGVSESGEIVNIDGTGNRVASSIFGHKEVYFLIGNNKIEESLEKAIWRARNIASPLNAKRLGRKTPCASSGRCHDCQSPERICKAMTIHMQKPKGIEYCEIVFIDEALGL